MTNEEKKYVKIGIISTISILLIILSFKWVPVGHIGIIKYFGQVNHEQFLSEGLNLVIPIYTTVTDFNTKIITAEANEANGSSKDLQDVNTSITVQFSFVDQHSYIFQRIGIETRFINSVLQPAILESVKAATAQFTAEELITKRPEVKEVIAKQINLYLERTLTDKELRKESVSIANVAITDFNFSEEFNKSIEEKVRAEQQALKALNDKERQITNAEAKAEQIRIESIATANAIEREGKALNKYPKLIELRQIERWDGTLPKVTGSYIPMLDVLKKGE